jgi:hypothetical protein
VDEAGGVADELLAQGRRRDERDFAGSGLAEMNARWTEEFTRRMAETEGDSSDFLTRLVKDFDKDVLEAKKGAPSIEAGRLLEDSLGDLRNRLVERGASFEGVAKAEQRQSALEGGLGVLRDVALRDPGLLDHALSEGEKLLAGFTGEVAPERLSALFDGWRRETTEAAIQTRIASDPEEAIQRIEKGEWPPELPQGEREKWLEVAKDAAGTWRAVRQAELDLAMAEEIAALEAGETPAVATDPALVDLVLGAGAVKAHEGRKQLARDFGASWGRLALLPEEKARARLAVLAPAAGEMDPARRLLHGKLAKALDERIRLLDDDPASVVAREAAKQVGSRLPGQEVTQEDRIPREYRARIALQGRLGVARPAALTRAEAGEFVETLNAEDAEGKIRFLDEVRGEVGEDVYRTILSDASGAGLPAGQQFGAQFLALPEKRHIGRALFRALATNEPDPGLDPGLTKQIKQEAEERFGVWISATGRSGEAGDLPLRELGEAHKKLALFFARQSPAGAAERAGEALLRSTALLRESGIPDAAVAATIDEVEGSEAASGDGFTGRPGGADTNEAPETPIAQSPEDQDGPPPQAQAGEQADTPEEAAKPQKLAIEWKPIIGDLIDNREGKFNETDPSRYGIKLDTYLLWQAKQKDPNLSEEQFRKEYAKMTPKELEAAEGELRKLEDTEAAKIYQKQFIERYRLDEIADLMIGEQVLDMIVNHGPGTGTKLIQRTLQDMGVEGKGKGMEQAEKVADDGAFGTQMIDAIKNAVAEGRGKELCERALNRRAEFIKNSGNPAIAGNRKGLLKRVGKMRQKCE